MTALFRRKSLSNILKEAEEHEKSGAKLRKILTVRDLTALGIAAVVGGGIFSSIGNAAANGGPAVSLLFIFTAIACLFSGLCYARFSSVIPINGSAYTYAYASFGELVAWIIGWDLIMEYAVGNIAVAISWSDYFTGLLRGLQMDIPEYLTTDYLSASRGITNEAILAWQSAPMIGGIRLIADIPAFVIVVLITFLVYIGINESKIAGNLMVLLKLIILLVVIGVGSFYVKPDNWSPFAPNGIAGILKGVSGVFFAYIGFDAISTTAEECRNPQKDLPRAMIYCLIITTILYVVISLVLTGMVHYDKLAGQGDPLAAVFKDLHLTKLSGIIAFGAIIAMASVLLVYQIGQPRIWMSMSRDGLLPKVFSKLHPRFSTPSFATIVTGIFVAVPSLFMNLTEMTDLTSIGTLFAFVLVCGGILLIDNNKDNFSKQKGFRIKYLNSRFFLPPILVFIIFLIFYFNSESVSEFFKVYNTDTSAFEPWNSFKHKIPLLIFTFVMLVISFLAIIKNLSLVPVLGLLTNLYLMSELGITNWLRFLIWLIIGLLIYFLYGYWKSKLRNAS